MKSRAAELELLGERQGPNTLADAVSECRRFSFDHDIQDLFSRCLQGDGELGRVNLGLDRTLAHQGQTQAAKVVEAPLFPVGNMYASYSSDTV